MSSTPRDPNATFDGLDGDDASAEGVSSTERFRVDDEVARGGLGRVHRGHDLALNREVAIKTLLHDHSDSHARFERETRLTAKLQHPNIVPVYDGGHDAEGMPFLVMRLVHGRSLDEAIQGAEGFEQRLDLLPHVVNACQAVAYAHSQRITHRDLKPDNLLVGDFGETVVIDWGLAKDVDAIEDAPTDLGDGFSIPSADSLTRAGSIVGTPAYMPPEQAVGAPVDERADVYALGAVLYHVLSGKRPYHGSADVVAAVVAAPPVPLRQLEPAVPPDLAAVVGRAMARSPDCRYPDAASLARDLERFRAGRQVHAHHYTYGERAQRFVARHPAPVALSTALIIGGLLATVVVDRARAEAQAQRQEAEAAQVEVAALEQAEREQLDRLTFEQARLMVGQDPARSLTLLASLSDEFPFDGAVRTVATAAWAARPPTPLAPPAGETTPTALAWTARGPAVVWGATLALYDHDLGLRTTIPLGASSRHLEVIDDGMVSCSSAGLLWIPATHDDPVVLSEEPCRVLSEPTVGGVTAGLEDGHLIWVHGGAAYPISTPVRSPMDLAVTLDGRRTLALGRDRALVIAEHDSGQTTSISLPLDTYSIFGSPHEDVAYALGGTTPLMRLEWDDDVVTMSAIPVAADWLEHAALPDQEHLLVGGSEDSVWVLDPDSGTLLNRVALRGAPRAFEVRNTRHVAVATDRGQLAVIDVRRGDLVELASADQPVLQLAWSPDESFLLAGTRDGVRVHSVRRREGGFLAKVEGRLWSLLENPTSQDLVVIGQSGAWSVSPDREVEQWTSRETFDAVSCGRQWWFAHDDTVVRWPDPIEPIPYNGVPLRLLCHRDEQVVVGSSADEVVIIDVDDPAHPHRRPLGVKGGPTDVWLSPTEDELWFTGATVVAQPLSSGPTHTLMPLSAAQFLADWNGSPVAVTSNGTVWSDTHATPLGQLASLPTVLEADAGVLIAADETGGVYVWSSPDTPPRRLKGHRQYVHDVALHPSGRWLATGGWDREVRLWDLSTDPVEGRLLPAHGGAVIALSWSADGATLYSGDVLGSVRQWSDPLSTDPAALRRQVDVLADAVAHHRLLPDASELQRLADSPP